MTAPVPATKAPLSAAEIAADVTKYAGLAVAVLEVIENTLPSVSIPASVQAIIAAVTGVLTLLLSVSKAKVSAQLATAKAAQ